MSSSAWREEYLSALKERSQIEKADQSIIDAYTQLADHFSSLSAASKNENDNPSTTTSPNTTTITTSSRPTSSTSTTNQPSTIPQLKADLAEALRSKGHFQSRLREAEEELSKLRAKTKLDSKRIEELVGERNALLVRVRDRDEELRGKGKLIEDVHDEMVSLNLQLNMAEQQKKKLQKENKELVDRWMARMGQEADAMNDASSFS